MRLCNEEDDQFAATSTPPIPEFDLAAVWGLAVIRADYESGMDVHDGCGGGADYRRRHLRLAFDGVRTERARGANRRREVRCSHAAARGNSGDSERLEESAARDSRDARAWPESLGGSLRDRPMRTTRAGTR